jgi:hypothetical protein
MTVKCHKDLNAKHKSEGNGAESLPRHGSRHCPATAFYRDHVIAWSEDLGRTIDYLETRHDLRTDHLAYEIRLKDK